MDNNIVEPYLISRLTNINNSNRGYSKIKIILFVIFILVLMVGIVVTTYLVQQRQNTKSKASSDIVAQVGDQQITKLQLDQAKLLFSDILAKPPTDTDVGQAALKFIIDDKVLRKYAQEKGFLDKASKIAEGRFQSSLQSEGYDHATFALANKNKGTYQDYLLAQVIEEELQQSVIKWRKISFLSIRYHFDDNAITEEKDYKDTVDKKILKYQKLITDEESLKNAIKQRCQDPEINYLPYDKKNKVYATTFNEKICREQALDLKVSATTNPMFGEKWLEKIFANTKKGEVSQIIDYTDKNLGMYFIVYEIDEGGESTSMTDLINNLKTSANIQIFQNQ